MTSFVCIYSILFTLCMAAGYVFYLYRKNASYVPCGISNVGAYIKKHGGEKND